MQQVRARRALALRRLGEIAAELSLEHAVDAAKLLLLAHLLAVVGRARTRAHAVLPGLGVELALRVERAARAFEEQVGSFAARELAFGSDVTSHRLTPVFSAGNRQAQACDFQETQRTKVGVHFCPPN